MDFTIGNKHRIIANRETNEGNCLTHRHGVDANIPCKEYAGTKESWAEEWADEIDKILKREEKGTLREFM